MNISNLLKHVSTNRINFLHELDKNIIIDKRGKYKHHTMLKIFEVKISNFVLNLDPDRLYVVIPLISINCISDNPYVTLSSQIILSSQSNPLTIEEFLLTKLDIFYKDFRLDEKENQYYHLIFKYKSVDVAINPPTFSSK